jgi:Fe-S cluster assembly ATP-binding protein
MSKSLTIFNLKAETLDGKSILQGISLTVKPGEIHAVMGPNGSGKSTLAQVLLGHPEYRVTGGRILLDGVNITKLPTDQRAKLGLFLGFQYPVEVPGVSFSQFLRLAAKEKLSPLTFRQLISETAKKLAFNSDISSRSLNEGFSGGEKKKSEILQLSVLKPKYAVLDEPDSGLDVDALKYIAETISVLKPFPGLILITHYQRILHYIKPDYVHILVSGRIVKSGRGDLADQIEKTGYEKFTSSK